MKNPTQPIMDELVIMNSSTVNHSTRMPVIRVDKEGKILYANEASIAFLTDSTNSTGEYIPAEFITRIPGMLSLNADFSVPVEISSQTIMFDVIGFEECGYIGLYGYAL